MPSVISAADFYIYDSLLHPVAVGVPLTLLLWLYLRLSPNRVLATFTKFDWIVSVTLGSTLSRIVTGSPGTHLDLVRGAVSLAVIGAFQLGLAYVTVVWPRTQGVVRAQPLVLVFRGRYVSHGAMRRGAIVRHDVRIGMRGKGVLRLEEIEVMLLEAGGAVSIVTTEMMRAWRCGKPGRGRHRSGERDGDGQVDGEEREIEEDGGDDEDVPESLIGVTQYAALCKVAAAERRKQEV